MDEVLEDSFEGVQGGMYEYTVLLFELESRRSSRRSREEGGEERDKVGERVQVGVGRCGGW
jgi:hypothetical protein